LVFLPSIYVHNVFIIVQKKKLNDGGKLEVQSDKWSEAHLIAISCSEAPLGMARWSLRMLADKMVELKYLVIGIEIFLIIGKFFSV